MKDVRLMWAAKYSDDHEIFRGMYVYDADGHPEWIPLALFEHRKGMAKRCGCAPGDIAKVEVTVKSVD